MTLKTLYGPKWQDLNFVQLGLFSKLLSSTKLIKLIFEILKIMPLMAIRNCYTASLRNLFCILNQYDFQQMIF